MTLRSRRDDDLDACERLARIVHGVDGYPPRRADDLRTFIDSPGAIAAWVAVRNESVVGHVALHPTSSDEVMALAAATTRQPISAHAVVSRLLVAPAHRRQGIARSLLTTAANAALERGRWPILDVATHLHSAIQLYEDAGWKLAGRVTIDILDDEPLDEFVYLGPASIHVTR